MKKKLITLLVRSFELSIEAQSTVKLHDLGRTTLAHNNIVPTVTSYEDEITIKSDTLLNDAEIVIRDQFGNVIHHSVENIGPMETTIFVPEDDGFNKKATIDLYYDRRRFCGNFNE